MKDNILPITCYVSTKERYDSTLSFCLLSLINQTKHPSELIIFDDADEDKRIDISKHHLLSTILKIAELKGIHWRKVNGEGKGQLLNHKLAFDLAMNDLIMRIDDDDFAEYNVIETLYNDITSSDDIGAVGCQIIESKNTMFMPAFASNKIEDLFHGFNRQWYIPRTNDIEEVDHLFSSFLYDRKKAKKEFYEYEYSPLGFREETVFTYSIKLNGYKILLDPKVVMWHVHPDSGGGNVNKQKEDFFVADSLLYEKFMEKNNIKKRKLKVIVLDNGLGDHFAFLNILQEIKDKYPDRLIVIGACFPDVFEGFIDKHCVLASIAEIKLLFGLGIWNGGNVYRFMDRIKLSGGKINLIDAFRMMYLSEKNETN